MKKIITLILSAIFIFSCTVAPTESAKITATEEIGSNKKIIVKVNTAATSRGAIDVIESEIVKSVVTVTSPDGTTESQTWLKNGSSTLTFNSQGPGSYSINVVETDSAGNESTYGSPFTVKQGVNIILSITPGSNIIVDITPAAPAIADSHVVTFADSVLENVVRTAVAKPAGDLTYGELKTVTSLNYSPATTEPKITNLSGIEYLTGLKDLTITNSQLSNLTPLKELTGLTKLALIASEVTDITPLANLTNITILHLHYNQIADITPLQNLTAIQTLLIQSNKIADLTPLAGLTALTELKLASNQITELAPLASLTNLSQLYLGNNQISDLTALTNLTALNYINLATNQITTITPLINNPGLSTGDQVYVKSGNAVPQAEITSLQAKGVTVN